MRTIRLTNGLHALVDNEDFDRLNQYVWYFKKKGKDTLDGYAARWIKGNKRVFMHRDILGTQPGFEIDHINGNGLDNRRDNIRFCTHYENMQNLKLSKRNTSGFRGVHWVERLNKWRSRITIDGKKIHLGLFSDVEEAARVCRVALIDHLDGLLCDRMDETSSGKVETT